MSKLSFTQKHALEQTLLLVLLYGYTIDGRRQYAYAAIKGDKLEALRTAMEEETFRLTDFGYVIHSGLGEPSDEVKAWVTQHYGFNHDNALILELPDE